MHEDEDHSSDLNMDDNALDFIFALLNVNNSHFSGNNPPKETRSEKMEVLKKSNTPPPGMAMSIQLMAIHA